MSPTALAPGHRWPEPHELNAGGILLDRGRQARDTHGTPVPVDPSPPAARAEPVTKPGMRQAETTSQHLLRTYADALDDMEATRIATGNRISALERDGLVVPESLKVTLEGLRALEHGAELELQRTLRKHPLGGWVKRMPGVGEKQGARLLAAIGDPAWNDLHDRPRTLSELWAYCGYHVVDGHAPRRRKGERANWSPEAKMRAYLVAESCKKQTGTLGRAPSPYRAVYDAERAKYADALHEAPCTRCGPSGRPAPPGSPLSAGHQEAGALRRVAKEILRDLWLEARSRPAA